jgi:hypothetical protein
MAMALNRGRAPERGLSIIEALVIVTVTAMLALLLLPLASRAGARDFALAERSLDAADAAIAEDQFRALLRAATQQHGQSFAGRADSAIFFPALGAAVACASAGASAAVRLRIVRRGDGGSLICESSNRQARLLSWEEGGARFSYSADGGSWTSTWAEAPPAPGDRTGLVRAAPLVKLELTGADGRTLSWVERAGWTETLPDASEDVRQ